MMAIERRTLSCLGLLGLWMQAGLGVPCGSSATEVGTPPDTVPLDGRGGGVIAYSNQPGPAGGIHEIFAINADGSGNRRLIQATVGLNHQDWAPGGRRVAATGYVSEATWSIYTFDADGTGLTRLTQVDGVNDSEPTWSPDGTRIVFTRIYPMEAGRNEIWIMNADGSGAHSLGIDGFGARWSPDGARFIYSSNRNGQWDLYVCNADGTGEYRLTATAWDEMGADWDPSGARIAFSSNEDGDWEIVVTATDGSGIRKLTSNTVGDFTPRWSPDGLLVAFDSEAPGAGRTEIYVVAPDGSGRRQVTNTPAPRTAINAAWRPTGS